MLSGSRSAAYSLLLIGVPGVPGLTFAAIGQPNRYEGRRHPNSRLQDVPIPGGGATVLLYGYQAKSTLRYRARPDFTTSSPLSLRPEATLQQQVILLNTWLQHSCRYMRSHTIQRFSWEVNEP